MNINFNFCFAVIVLICSSSDARSILLQAKELGMANGPYVFFVLQQFEVSMFETIIFDLKNLKD